MQYKNTIRGIYINRPNRFEAYVEIDGKSELVHVKNTGRCTGVLIPGVEVILEKSDNQNRKTKYDLIAAYKPGFGLINLDSQAPNKVARQYLESMHFDLIKSEYAYGKSRIDFYMEKGDIKYLCEVKGCTFERDGIGYFPDAPTQRGVKHLRELTESLKEGYHAMIAFVIGMNGINKVQPNSDIHPEFAVAFEEAVKSGVEVLYIPCVITENSFDPIKSF